MAVLTQQAMPLTYEQYMALPESEGQYDIVDGIILHMTNPTRRHQEVGGNVYIMLRAYQRELQKARVYQAPSDVLIRRTPLRTRQPDVYLISNERLAECGPSENPAPLERAPELAVEILSPSDTRFALASKLQDYAIAGVDECWLVSPESGTVQVVGLRDGAYHTIEIYGDHDVVQSVIFPDLKIKLDDIFAA